MMMWKMKKYAPYGRRSKYIRFPLYINSSDMDIVTLHKVKYSSSNGLFIYFFKNVDLLKLAS